MSNGKTDLCIDEGLQLGFVESLELFETLHPLLGAGWGQCGAMGISGSTRA